MITLHHLNNSRSTRIIWLLEELKLDYKLVSYQRQDNQLAPDALKKIHPLGKAPILVDDATSNPANPLVIAESAAIIEYLIHNYDNNKQFAVEVGSQTWQTHTFWLHFAEGSAMTPLLFSLVFGKIPAKSPRIIRPIAKAISKGVMQSFVTPNLNRHNDFIEDHLANNPWFAGEQITGADIQMSFVIEAINVRCDLSQNPNTYPNITQWLKKVRARPAYKTALKKGGELQLG